MKSKQCKGCAISTEISPLCSFIRKNDVDCVCSTCLIKGVCFSGCPNFIKQKRDIGFIKGERKDAYV